MCDYIDTCSMDSLGTIVPDFIVFTEEILERLTPEERVCIGLKYKVSVFLQNSNDLVAIRGHPLLWETPDLRLEPDTAVKYERARRQAVEAKLWAMGNIEVRDLHIAGAFRSQKEQQKLLKEGRTLSKYSWHLSGRAIDISVVYFTEEQKDKLQEIFETEGFTTFIEYHGWLEDTRKQSTRIKDPIARRKATTFHFECKVLGKTAHEQAQLFN